jgi:hypothetical protein
VTTPTARLMAAGAVVLVLVGCTAGPASVSPADPQIAEPSTTHTAEASGRTECDSGTTLNLRVSANNPTAGETVEVSTTPGHCLVTKEWEGDVIVRIETADPNTNPDTPTGVRLEAGTVQPVTVEIPAGLEGVGYIMLEPDVNCEAQFGDAVGDCYFPYADITIEPSGS